MPFIIEFVLLLIPVLIIGLLLLFSSFFEHRHLRSLDRREEALKGITVTDLKTPVTDTDTEVRGAHLVSGQAVIGCDYFKSWLAGLRNLVGGGSALIAVCLDPCSTRGPGPHARRST